MKRLLATVCVVTACQWGAVQAQTTVPQRYNVVDLAATVQREVSNDLMTAQLFTELSDANPAQLANQLNRAVAGAVAMAKEYPQVKVRTGNNQTYPVYGRNNQTQGWRGRAELRIETRDFGAGAALVGKLQSTLQLGGIQFAVSNDARQKVENELIAEAIAAFRQRAEIARTALGGKTFKVQRLGLNAGTSGPPPRPMLRAAAMASDVAVAAPPIEAGESVVSVSANGSIEVD